MHMASGGSSFNSAGLVKKPNMNYIELFITDVVSEGSFLKIWAQADRMAAIFIDRIMFAHKNNFDKGIGSVQQLNQLQIGLLCCGKYTDGNYYRCKILSFITHAEVNVIFVDYGYTAPIHISNIRLFDNLAQDKTYLEGHELSSEYYLAHGVPKAHQWDSEDVKIIKQRLCFKELKCLILEEMYGKKFVKIFINDIDFVQILKYNNLADEVLLDAQRVILRSLYSFDFPPPPFPSQKISSLSTTTQTPSFPSCKISSVLTTEPVKKSSAPPFQSEMLAPGTKHQVYVSHVEDGPLSFSVQIKDVAEKSLVQMMAQINSTSNIKNLSGPWLPGVVCLGRFSEDQSLCRAIIMNIYDEKCLLYYVDYGNSEVLPHTEIFEIPLQFVDIKVVAMRFTLANIKDISFSDKVKAYFKDQVTFKLVVIEVTETESSPLKQYCEMFIDGENIKVKLLEKVRAEHPPAFIKQHLPITRTREDIVVTYVESPSCLYVQLNKNKEALSTVMGCVDIICKKGAAQLTKDKLQPGTVCCALYSADQVWYRAQILMVYEETASVLFVDYGNQDIVPLALLREIKSDLVEKVRTQAVECCLIGYHNILPDQAISMKLEELILEQTLTMEVLDYTNNHIPIVELYDVNMTKISSKLANTQVIQLTSAGQQPHTFNTAKDRDEWNDLPASSQPNLNNDSNPSSDGVKNKSKWSHDNEDWQDKFGSKNLHREKDKTSWRNKENSNKLSKNLITDGGWPEEDVGSSDSKPRKFDRYDSKKSFKFNSRDGDNSSEGDKSDQFEDRGSKKFENSSGRDYKRKGGDSGFGNDRGGEGGFRSNRGNGHFKRDSGFRSDRGDGSFKRDGFKNDRGDGSFKRDGFRNDRGGGNFKRDRGDSYQTEFSGNNKMSTWGGGPKELTVPQSVVSVGFTGIVEIVYSISPSEFYVQLTSDIENLTALMSDIASSFSTGGGEIIDNPKKGQFCIAKYSEDETWYRGCIETINTGSCDVVFVDYGNHEEVNNDNIKKMKESFTILPIQSVKCELYGCVSPSEGWSEEEVSNFIANCEGKTLSANFVEKVFSKNSFKVVLTDQESGVVINTSTTLGYSVPEENVNAALAKMNEKTYCDFPIQLGSNLRVQPTWFISPSQFYVQPLNSESEYRKMIEQMQTIVKKGVIKPTSQLKVGDSIIAKFKEDNVLYRARVKSDGHSPTVTFVDYGNTAKVESGMVWELEPQYAILPVQAICCALSGIVPVEETWSKAGTSNIISYFTGDEFNCTFVDQQNGIYTVNLFNGDKNVAQELVANGLAIEESIKHSDKGKIIGVELALVVGQIFSVVITHIENSKKFYICLMPEQASAWLQILQEDAKILKALPMEQLKCGKICIHKNDDYLNRCKIMDIENMRVFYIDSGLFKEVKSEDLFELPASKEYPALTTQCELYLQERLTEELEVQFKSTATSKPYFAYVNGLHIDKLQITLYEKDGQPSCYRTQNLIVPFVYKIICPMPILSSHQKVIVSYASGDSVYLHKPELVDSSIEFLGKLFNFYNALEYEEREWETDMYCAAKSSADEQWYRAKIKNIEQEEITVYYIDYGNLETLPVSSLRKLDDSFHAQHEYAFKVKFHVEWKVPIEKLLEVTESNIYNAVLLRPNYYEWMAELIDPDGISLNNKLTELGLASPLENSPFKRIIEGGKFVEGTSLSASILHIESPTEFWLHLGNDVQTYVEEIQDRLQLAADKLKILSQPTELFAAKYCDDQWYRAVHITDNIVRFIDYGNCDTVDMSDLRELTSDFLEPAEGYAVKCLLTVECALDEWTDEIKLNLEEFLMNSDRDLVANIVTVIDKSSVIAELYLGEKNISEYMIEQGLARIPKKYAGVYVSHVNSPSDFYVQLDGMEIYLEEISKSMLAADTFQEISDFGNISENLIAAKFSFNGLWYRAKIIEEDENIKVLFVDYGNCSVATEFRALPKELRDKPIIAKHCSLNLPPEVIKWSEAACKVFEDLVAAGNEKLYMFEETPGDPIIVTLLTSQDEEVVEQLKSVCVINCINEPIIPEDAKEPETHENTKEPKMWLPVFISHANSPNDFYIQPQKSSTDLELMTEQLQEFKNFKIINNPCDWKNKLVTGYNPSNGKWCRAKVIEALESGVKVFFIDYGNFEVITDVRELKTDLVETAVSLLHCSLKLIEDEIIWPAACEKFFEIFSDIKDCEVCILEKGIPNTISLRFKDNIIEDILINTSKKSIIEPREEKGNDLQNTNSDIEENPDSMLTVSVSYVNSPCDFYVQIKEHQILLEKIADILSDADTFDDLSLNNEKELIGQLVVGQFEIDNLWYRTKILSINNLEAEALFVDFGYISTIKKFKTIPKSLTDKKFIALHCSLKRPDEVDNWSELAVEKFSDIAGKDSALLQLKVLEKCDAINLVDLYYDGQPVTDILLKLSIPNNTSKNSSFIAKRYSNDDTIVPGCISQSIQIDNETNHSNNTTDKKDLSKENSTSIYKLISPIITDIHNDPNGCVIPDDSNI